MGLTFLGAQKQVDERVNQHPDGYWDDKKCFNKLEEEKKEMQDALALYHENPIDENLKALETEFGDELFAIICLANKLEINLEECFNLMMEKNRNRAKNGYKKEEK